MTIAENLSKYFGYDSFRGGQEELINKILEGTDVLGIMPTGAGKSICFQLPAVMQEGVTIVISPLISLMKDQVDALIQAGIPAAYINSSLSKTQTQQALYNAQNGKYKLIYVAPERLTSPDFIEFAEGTKISMLTIDEAHCISQWGQDFRPSYANIPAFVQRLTERPVISAFTATATERVKEDIVESLALKNPTVLVTGFDRENLYFEVQRPRNKMKALIDFVEKNITKSGIVYCSTRKNVEEVCSTLNDEGFSASRYHAGLSEKERNAGQDDFLFDRVQIMVATNAFGMGIDKSNVKFVVHYNMPKDIESYYQEAGRAGRDGSNAECLLMYSGYDVRTHQWLIENAKGGEYESEQAEQELKQRDYDRLKSMTFYSTTNDCLRAYLLRYFGEKPTNYCGDCSNCNTNFELVDITEDAQKIISCVYRMGEKFGIAILVDVLRGINNDRVREFGFNKLTTFGISDKSSMALKSIISYLLLNGYIKKSTGTYPILLLDHKAQEGLKGEEKIEMKLAKEKVTRAATAMAADKGLPEDRIDLFTEIKQLRAALAKAQNVPAFVVFTDKTLVEMCTRLPLTTAHFLAVPGVSERKRELYSEDFLRVIGKFCDDKGIDIAEKTIEEAAISERSKKKDKMMQLPTAEIIETIKAVEQPVPISMLNIAINEVLTENGCITTTAVKLTSWLEAIDYLEKITVDGQNKKEPTKRGREIGITQEERKSPRGEYSINLYSQQAQQFIIDNIFEILSVKK